MEKLGKNTNALNWFEIPVVDVERAKKFYQTILDIEMETTDMMGLTMTFFPSDGMNGKVSGALVKGEMFKPSADGAVVYLNANPEIQKVIDKVEVNGGKIIVPKTLISDEIGYLAFIMDTEGNRVALHAGK
ncbi:VOC family protein [Solitalea lacus]|uniref:VOC family protein n=1 Tax=Solitalea lacus TaxID=2911172 RepID=UPI001EDABFAC|nr:VOC family protein [Solitalea lacus]UKJ06044.1 VOC family protein [Solitalea lacus]